MRFELSLNRGDYVELSPKIIDNNIIILDR